MSYFIHPEGNVDLTKDSDLSAIYAILDGMHFELDVRADSYSVIFDGGYELRDWSFDEKLEELGKSCTIIENTTGILCRGEDGEQYCMGFRDGQWERINGQTIFLRNSEASYDELASAFKGVFRELAKVQGFDKALAACYENGLNSEKVSMLGLYDIRKELETRDIGEDGDIVQ